MLLNSGDVFAGFTIERLLGQGGMGSVYLARHPRLDRLTALKLLNRDLFADASVRARFEREADLVAQLDHPGIVAVYDRGTEDEQLWICMQYVDGADAGTVNPLNLPPDKAVQIIEGVAPALDYAHGMGVLHRDVKPANIMLARSGGGHGERVFLTDFGLARLRAETTRLTQTGMFTATLAFASPEQMTGQDLDHRSDQYSLACTLYWLLTGMAPFDSPNPADIIHGNLQLAPPPLAVKRPGLPAGLDSVLATAMAKHPAHRFTSCAEFAAAARHALTRTAASTVAAPYPQAAGSGGSSATATGTPGPRADPSAAPHAHDHPDATPQSETKSPGYPGVPASGDSAPPYPASPEAPPSGQVPAQGWAQPAAYTAPPYAPHPGQPHPAKRGPSLALLLIPLVVLLVVAAALGAAVFVLGGEGVDDADAAAPATGTDATAAPGSSSMFPSLLPQGEADTGSAYQNAVCTRYEPGEPVEIEHEALESRPWASIWVCDRKVADPSHMSYTILTYDSPEDARAVIEDLPVHNRTTGAKSGAPYTAHHWSEPGPPGPLYTTNLVIGFGDAPARGNSLVYVSYRGAPEAQEGDEQLPSDVAVMQWWADAPL